MLAAGTSSNKESWKLENSYLQCSLENTLRTKRLLGNLTTSSNYAKWSLRECKRRNSCPSGGVGRREGCIAHQWRALALQYLRSLSGSTSCPFLQHWPHTNFIWRSKVLDVGARGEAWGREPAPQASRAKTHPLKCHSGSSQSTHVPETNWLKQRQPSSPSPELAGGHWNTRWE